jgi:hypothetical protein
VFDHATSPAASDLLLVLQSLYSVCLTKNVLSRPQGVALFFKTPVNDVYVCFMPKIFEFWLVNILAPGSNDRSAPASTAVTSSGSLQLNHLQSPAGPPGFQVPSSVSPS